MLPKTFKKITVLVVMVFMCIMILSACSFNNRFNNNDNDSDTITDIAKNPITKITLNNTNTTLIVGETLYLDYTVSPVDSDEECEISVGDTSVISLVDNYIIAKKVGETYVNIHNQRDINHGKISKEIYIRVVEEFNYSIFENKYSTKMKQATLKVFCKRYNKNWLGKEKDVYTVEGSGTIIKSTAYSNYVLTDKSIFDPVSTSYEYEEWRVEDYLGKQYPIAGINYHLQAGIAIGTFTSSTKYSVIDVFESYAYKGDYAITAVGSPIDDRIASIGYEKILSSTSNVFYHQAGLSSKKAGVAVFNSQCQIIGVNVKYSTSTVTSVSAIEIRSLIDRIFNGLPSGGGPIDIA